MISLTRGVNFELSRIAILIPAYRPDKGLEAFAAALKARNLNVLVVDDGSGKGSRDLFSRVKETGAAVVHHASNLGKGRAIKTGIREISKRWPHTTGIVTSDCDGQHSIFDIERTLLAMSEHPNELILGRRELDKKSPARSRFGNELTRIAFRAVTGIRLRDTQSGLRGLPAKWFPQLLELEGDRYDYEMNMLLNLKAWGAEWQEIPIEAIYHNRSADSHYRPVRDSLLIAKQLFKKAAPAVSVTLDYLLFWLLCSLAGLAPATSYGAARVFSLLFNYFCGCRPIPQKGGSSLLVRALALAAGSTALGSFGVYLLTGLAGLPALPGKLAVDLPLFLLSYLAYRKFSSARKREKNARTS